VEDAVTTVRETTHELLRTWGLTTIFGNPGSNELPFLDGLPADFRYVLGLHEGAVLAMADGYAQATGRPAFVNLHSAAGLGNAMGNLTNTRAAHTPLVVTAGQQSRAMVGLGAVLAEPELTRVPEPHVKWSFEPARAQDVPRALSEAFHLAALPPAGPVFVSLPLDDWTRPVDAQEVALLAHRRVHSAGAAAPQLLADLADRLARARAPVIVVGPEVDNEHAYPLVVALAERIGAPVWTAPVPPRCPFPTRHRLWQGVLPPSIAGVSEHLTGHDLIVALGAPIFRYHVYLPGPWLPAGAELVALLSDPHEASRAAFGDAVVADVGAVVEQLLDRVPAREREPHLPARPGLDVATPDRAPFTANAVFAELARWVPVEVPLVNESTSNTVEFWTHLNRSRPRSLFFPAAGGLGFGLPAAVGVALADPARPVVAVLGDGALQYGVTGLWTAAQLGLPITFLVLRNGGYEGLRGFLAPLGVTTAPGLDLPGLDAVPIARGYGVPAESVTSGEELAAALRGAVTADGPRLFEVPIGPQALPLT
jgi:benzoylformate decarboxylase